MSLSKLIQQIDNTFIDFPSAVWIKDLQATYQYANRFWLKITNYSHKQIFEKSDEDCYWNEFAHDYKRQDKEAMEHGFYHQLDFCHLGNKNNIQLILNKKVPLKDADGIIHGTLGMVDVVKNLQLFNLTAKVNQLTGNTIRIRDLSSPLHNDEKQSEKLTNTEAECLFYLLQGKPSKTIGAILNKAQKTVEFHINNIKAKWNCHTKSDIFAMAYELGYFNILPASLYNNMLEASLTA